MMRAVHHLSTRTYLEYYKYRRSSNCGYFPGGGGSNTLLGDSLAVERGASGWPASS